MGVQDCLRHHGMDEHQPDKRKKELSMSRATGQAEMVKTGQEWYSLSWVPDEKRQICRQFNLWEGASGDVEQSSVAADLSVMVTKIEEPSPDLVISSPIHTNTVFTRALLFPCFLSSLHSFCPSHIQQVTVSCFLCPAPSHLPPPSPAVSPLRHPSTTPPALIGSQGERWKSH